MEVSFQTHNILVKFTFNSRVIQGEADCDEGRSSIQHLLVLSMSMSVDYLDMKLRKTHLSGIQREISHARH